MLHEGTLRDAEWDAVWDPPAVRFGSRLAAHAAFVRLAPLRRSGRKRRRGEAAGKQRFGSARALWERSGGPLYDQRSEATAQQASAQHT